MKNNSYVTRFNRKERRKWPCKKCRLAMLVAAMAMTASILAGCGGKDSGSDEQQDPIEKAVNEQESATSLGDSSEDDESGDTKAEKAESENAASENVGTEDGASKDAGTEDAGTKDSASANAESEPSESGDVPSEGTEPENDGTKGEEASEPTDAGLSPEFKEAMDRYEAFMDEYVAFMKKYRENSTDPSLLADYATYTGKYAEFVDSFGKWENEEMNTDEAIYYIEVQSRVNQKLLEVAQ